MKKLIIPTLVLSVLVSCATERNIPSKVNVKSVEQMSNATNNTLLYSLPKTKIRIDVTVEKVISKVGPFYRYSQKMLNVTDVVTEDNEAWKIKDVEISTYGVADSNKRYAISYSGSNIAPLINLTADGVLYGFNAAGSCGAIATDMETDYTALPGLEAVNFNAVPMLEKQLLKTSTAAMAQEAANMIYKIRKRRMKILSSDFEHLPPDGRAYEVVVSELNALEQSFLELFVGKKEVYTETRSFDIEPGITGDNNDVLFRFSTVKGIVDKMDVSGAPVYIEIEVQDQVKVPDAPLPVGKEEPQNGLFYCQPGKVTVKLIDRNELIKVKQVYVAQYGQVISLPVSVLEEDNLIIRMDETTGAIKFIQRK